MNRTLLFAKTLNNSLKIKCVIVKNFLQKMTEFEPIRCWPIRLLWKKKSKMQGSFEALLLFIAKYHDNMEPMLKSLCKKHLSYKRRSAGNDDKGKIRIINSCQKVSQNSVQMLKKLAVTSFFSCRKF